MITLRTQPRTGIKLKIHSPLCSRNNNGGRADASCSASVALNALSKTPIADKKASGITLKLLSPKRKLSEIESDTEESDDSKKACPKIILRSPPLPDYNIEGHSKYFYSIDGLGGTSTYCPACRALGVPAQPHAVRPVEDSVDPFTI